MTPDMKRLCEAAEAVEYSYQENLRPAEAEAVVRAVLMALREPQETYDVAEAETDARRPLKPRFALGALLPPNCHGRHHGPSLRSYGHIGTLPGGYGEAGEVDAAAHHAVPVPGRTVSSKRVTPWRLVDPAG